MKRNLSHANRAINEDAPFGSSTKRLTQAFASNSSSCIAMYLELGSKLGLFKTLTAQTFLTKLELSHSRLEISDSKVESLDSSLELSQSELDTQ